MAITEERPPAALRSQTRRPAGSSIDVWTWFFMRLSGIVLLVLVLGHFTIVHLMGGGVSRVNFAFVEGRWSSPFWQTWDWTMLFLGMLHGANGMKVLINDYMRSPGGRVAAKSVLYTLTLILILLGTLIIVTFDPTRLCSKVVGKVAGC